ncbi:tyrosine recombinase XerC [mine drainage metagenome]|uniref:Tyrosine recombinase XerC n=1 Tax=mine drainage metagenome TaxID=410659 RepID=A0A1J5PII0_9ZZZZ
MVLDELVKLPRQHMERNAELAIRIQQDEIIGILVTVEIHAAIALDEPDLVGLAQPEIFFSRGNDVGVDFDHIDLDVRHGAPQIGRYRSGAQPDHQNALGCLRIGECHRHDPAVQLRHDVGILEIDRRLDVVGAPLVPAAQRKQRSALVDEENIVLGFQMRDAAIAVLEHLRAHVFVDQLTRADAIAGEHDDREDDEPGRRPDHPVFCQLHAIYPRLFGTHSLRRTKATLIYRRTGNLRADQLLLGHTKIESTVKYLGIEVDDALAIAEQVDA